MCINMVASIFRKRSPQRTKVINKDWNSQRQGISSYYGRGGSQHCRADSCNYMYCIESLEGLSRQADIVR